MVGGGTPLDHGVVEEWGEVRPELRGSPGNKSALTRFSLTSGPEKSPVPG
jgi:hypothetical protein